MEYYRFRSSDGRLRALARDRTGSRLPSDRCDWHFLGRQVVDDRLGLAPDELAARVRADGYCLLPPGRT